VIEINLSSPEIASQISFLSKENLVAFQKALKKILKMSWNQIYKDNGLRLEEISSASDIYLNKKKFRPCSIRITKKFRAIVCRSKNVMIFISLHPNHDSAY